MSALGGKVAPKFRDVFNVSNKDPLRWFPGHMGKGLKQMQSELRNVDCVIEVHDARIPLSGRYIDFNQYVTGLKPHIFVLNKADLFDGRYKARVIRRLREEFKIEWTFFTNFKTDTCMETRKIMTKAVELIKESDRFNRTHSEELTMMIIGAPNVGKSSLINRLRNEHLGKANAAQVGAKAGITRSVMNRIRISQNPDAFVLDTPGILDPQVRNVYGGLKLALCGCIDDGIVGPEIMSDYLLFWLNKYKRFDYVSEIGLREPTDNVLHLLTFIAAKYRWTAKVKNVVTGKHVIKPNLQTAANHFINLFRTGKLGKYCLDADMLD